MRAHWDLEGVKAVEEENVNGEPAMRLWDLAAWRAAWACSVRMHPSKMRSSFWAIGGWRRVAGLGRWVRESGWRLKVARVSFGLKVEARDFMGMRA